MSTGKYLGPMCGGLPALSSLLHHPLTSLHLQGQGSQEQHSFTEFEEEVALTAFSVSAILCSLYIPDLLHVSVFSFSGSYLSKVTYFTRDLGG